MDAANNKISPLRTHEDDAVIHVESPVKVPFSLGQLLTEWGVVSGPSQVVAARAVPERHLAISHQAEHHGAACHPAAGLSKPSWVPPEPPVSDTPVTVAASALPASAAGPPAEIPHGRSLLVLVSVSRI